MFTTLVKAN